MSKRNKKFRSNRSAFKLEALEQRQLLATIVGGTGGTEVGSDITVSGKVYDQILMTGSTLSVQADSGQTVRVDFLDADGDIVRAEFSGTTGATLNISLANFVAAATPTKYTGITTKYVSGLASFTITGSDANTSFLVTSLGPAGPAAAFQGLLNPIFAGGTTTGGNNTANIARVVIVGDSTNLVGGVGTAFGTLNAANAIFSDTSGVVGIYAPNTSFKAGGSISIGDIVLGSTTATPVITINGFSDVKTVTVAGGKLASVSGGVGYTATNVNVATLASSTGTNSLGTKLDTQTLSNVGAAVATYSSGLGTVTIDGSTATTASLDALYRGKYLQDVVINNGLPAGVIFRTFQFGNITVNGNLAGVITTDANSNNLADGAEQAIGNVTINGSIVDGGYIESATSIGNVTVTGGITHTVGSSTITVNNTPGVADQIAVISTLGKSGLSAAIGNVSVTGDINLGTSTTAIAEGLISDNRALTTANAVTSLGSTGGIGNISAANVNIYSSMNTTTGLAAVINHQGPSGQSIGTVTFSGDVVVNNGTTAGNSGFISSVRNIGAITVKSLTMTTPGASGIATTANNGNIGAITSTGSTGIVLVGGIISANGAGSVGNISVQGTGNLYMGATGQATLNTNTSGISGGSIGTISVTSGNLTTGTNAGITAASGGIGGITLTSGTLNINKDITATGGNVGDILLTDTSATTSTLNDSSIKSVVGNSVGGAVGNITVTKGNLSFIAATTKTAGVNAATTVGNITLNAGSLLLSSAGTGVAQVASGTTIGNVAINGNLTFTGAASTFKAGTGSAAGTSIGNITIAAGASPASNDSGKIIGTSGGLAFQANQIGNVSVTGGSAITSPLLTDVIFVAKGTTQGTIATAKIGNITLNSSATGTGDIATATAASTSATAGTGFSSSGSIGNVTLTTGSGTSAEIVSTTVNAATGNLVIRAGASGMGLNSNVTTTAGTATTAVGNGFAVNTANGATTSENVESVSIGDVTINAVIVGGNLGSNQADGRGLIIASGVNNATAGRFITASSDPLTLPTPYAGLNGSLTNGTIGNVVISDLAGSVVKTQFNSSGLTTGGSEVGGSIIIADKINGITVNSGSGAILSLSNLGGLPLKGAIGNSTGITTTAQTVVGNNVDNLLVVVL